MFLAPSALCAPSLTGEKEKFLMKSTDEGSIVRERADMGLCLNSFAGIMQ